MLQSFAWVVPAARRFFCTGIVFGLAAPAFAQAPVVDYGRQIRPLLSDRCFKCHGPDEGQRQSGLRLDLRDAAFGKGESGATVIVAGQSADSELIRRITSDDPAQRMPPADSGKSLSPAEIELMRNWIAQGANWKDHWSFVKPNRPAPPAVAWEAQVRNPIDRFVFARLAREKLSPAPRADKPTLIRRVTYDLTGLPPTLAEINAFLADESDDAYEKLIDRLLKSPRYGEHMGRYWLDAVRYGDTHGLHLDNERSLWPYRDWVIGAFNRNLPFDRFTIEQIGGDLLAGATLEQKIASGYNRCNVSTSEGGSIDDEVLVRYAVDRTEAVSTVWMGMTMGCAVCHNHKFDPISQKEFYQLYAFFNAAADPAMDGNALLPPPQMKIPSTDDAARLKTFDDQVAAVRARIAVELAKIEYQEPPAPPVETGPEPRDFVWIDDEPPTGAKLEGNSPWEFATAPQPVLIGSKSSKRTAQGLSQHFFTGASVPLKVGEGDKLFAHVYLDPANPPKEIMLQWNDGSWEHRAIWGDDVIPWGQAGAASRQAVGPLPKVGEWVRIEVEAAKVGLAPGTLINGWAFTQHDGTCYWDKSGIATRTPQQGQGFESLATWESYEKVLAKPTAPEPVVAAIKVEAAQRTLEQAKLIRDHFLENVYAKTQPVFAPMRQEIADLTKKRGDYDAAIPSTMIMADMPQPRETFILVRGQYDHRGDKVTANVPAIFPPLPSEAPINRLGLAQWLMSPEHPLTARVTVNRLWQQVFGTGLVKTSEDFGSQGQQPTHPELLDWLAVEFREQGWNVQQFMKLMLMSHTYQQSSHVSAELALRDPANELLARGPRFRLDAEVLRDSALSLSGLLIEKVGGKSVKPYQPDGLWEAVGFVGSNTSVFKQDAGEALYRRSMYTFWKRTSPPPSLTTFDAPSRENCTVRRPRTNTPLQALVLMNDKQFVEAARKLAERMMTEGGASFAERAEWGFRVVTARKPSAEEMSVLERVFARQSAFFTADADATQKLLGYGDTMRNEALPAGELASYTMIANMIMNLDESVTKEQADLRMNAWNEYQLNETRRYFFGRAAAGLGVPALASLLNPQLFAADANSAAAGGLATDGLGTLPLLHHRPTAKRVIWLFMADAPSQLDMFDYKPKMQDYYDKELPESVRQGQRLTTMTSGQARFPVAPSLFKFAQHGQNGAWLSELLPHTASIVDNLAIVKTMFTEAINHDPAITYIQTGSQIPGRPSLGAWLAYGIGSSNHDLPSYVVLHSRLATGSQPQALFSRLWGSGFLPTMHQGVALRSTGDPVLYLSNPPGVSTDSRRVMLDGLADLNRKKFETAGDPEIQSRIAQYEMAFKMQMSVPELVDISREPKHILDAYGPEVSQPGSYAYNCLLARRLAERGVRFTQVFLRGWDHHGNLPKQIPDLCKAMDQPTAALINDLKRRGMLDDTLVVWGGEFGRTIYSQGTLTKDNYGRDHHPRNFTMWFAGGGVKAGTLHGETDDFSYNIQSNPVHIHDLNATILHCLGIDHTRLTYRFQGRDFRLTDVHGNVVKEILA